MLPPESPRRFPALDAEPPPRPVWRRILIPAVALAIAAVAVGLVLRTPAASHPHTAPPPAFNVRGSVVVWRANGSLAISDPDGSHITARTKPEATQYPMRSPSGRYAVTISGDLWSLTTSSVHHVTANAWGGHALDSIPLQPFADRDHYLVLGGRGAIGEHVPTQLVARGSGRRSQRLGSNNPDQVMGDPSGPAVFLSEPAGRPMYVGNDFQQPDGSVLLAPLHRRPTVLITARRARAILRLSGRLALMPWPSLDGNLVAVEARELSGRRAGVVILDRAGRKVDGFEDSAASEDIEWSRSGVLAVITSSPGQVTIWKRGSVRRLPIHLPSVQNVSGECTWSPDSVTLLCPTSTAGGIADWLLLQATSGKQQLVPAPGLPIAWFSGGAR
jgi:hypothetical protein